MRLLHLPNLLRALLALAFAAVAPSGAVRAASPIIAAAASLRYALDDAAATFRRETGQELRITYAASGTLVHQIETGAPYRLFLSADEDHALRLAARGLSEGQGVIYATGVLVLAVPKATGKDAIALDPRLRGLGRAIRAGKVRHLSIANPAIAPYGQRAEAALRATGLFDAARPFLVFGENVGQAFQFLASGGADAGLVPLSLVTGPQFTGRYVVIDPALYPPLRQRMVLLKGADPATRRFFAFLEGPEGRAILGRHGFRAP